MSPFLALLILDLEFPTAHSLKDKRAILRSLIAGIRKEFQVSVSEVAFQNRIRSSTLAVALVSGSQPELRKVGEQILNHLDRHPEAELFQSSFEWR
ncbi:MAG: DUF503 domain-containing protein [Fimbriimonadales bacterium]